MGAKNKPNELYLTRIYDAPVKIVWEAWTDPKQVAQWWGPRGFTITTKSKDVRTGGVWDYIMHGPDGTDYPNYTKFLEVEKYSRMVYDHGGFGDKPPMFRVTVDFIDLGGKTKMEFVMALATPEAAKATKKFVKQAQGDSTWDRLAEYLSPTDNFVINRSFEAPIDLVFDMWTDPEHLKKWLPPTGFKMEYMKAEIKTCGSSFFSMANADGMKMYCKTSYNEITKPNQIVYTQIFCDENGKVSRHPMAPTWPETMLVKVVFTVEEEDRTRVTVTTEVIGEASAIELETFNSSKGGMTFGWSASFDKLEECLEKK